MTVDDAGKEVWNVADYAFVNELEAVPDTVNPSLFRNTLYNSYAGLFEVCDGIYQVRGYDMANATFIRTDNGWIVFDVLMCREDMAAAKALMEKHFGGLDIRAVLYSHSHIDHYGGIFGLLSQEDAADASLTLEEQLASGKTVILATGTTHRTLGLPGEEDLIGSAISFCAVCDGEFYRDKTVVMVGGGNSAFVESAMLVNIVKKLILLQDSYSITEPPAHTVGICV